MLPKWFQLKVLLLPLILCAGIGPTAHAQAAEVEWVELSLDEALAEARETGEILMIDVGAGHCGACGDMDRDLWGSAEGTFRRWCRARYPHARSRSNQMLLRGPTCGC